MKRNISLWFALCSVFSAFVSHAESESKTYSLKYVPVEDAITQVIEALGEGKKIPIEENEHVKSATIESTRLIADVRKNIFHLTTENRNHAAIIDELLRRIDVRPVTFSVSAAILEMEDASGEAIAAVVKRVKSSKPDFEGDDLEKDFKNYVSLLAQSEQCKIISQPSLFLKNKSQGIVSMGSETKGGTDINSFTVFPKLEDDGRVTVRVAWSEETSDNEKDADGTERSNQSKSEIETTVTVNSGEVMVLGGVIRSQARENTGRILLVQPRLYDWEAVPAE